MRRLIPLLLLAACDYGFEKQSHISKLRVLAVRAEPPEILASAPPAEVTFTALAVDPSGAPIEMHYALCQGIGLPAAELSCPGEQGMDLESSGPTSARLDLRQHLAMQVPSGAPDVIPLAIGFRARPPGGSRCTALRR